MNGNSHVRRAAAFACCLAAVAALAALASASTALASNTYGSGAAIQKSLQELWIKDSGLSATYTATNSEDGFNEFGYNTGALEPTLDSTAFANGKQLDGYVAVDNAPLAAELKHGETAAGAGTGVTVPVAQVPLGLLANLPADIEPNSTDSWALSNELAAEAYSGNVPEDSPYPANTWGALLLRAWSLAASSSLTVITSGSPTTGEFLDTGTLANKTGGYAPITVQVRTNGAGATLALKQYFDDVDPTNWGSTTIDENTEGSGEWPSGVTPDGYNASDTNEAEAVSKNAGEIGYGTLGAATLLATNPFGFKFKDIVVNNILTWSFWWELEDNFKSGGSAQYGNPALNGTSEEANVYTGTTVGVNGGTGVGNWVVPHTGTSTFEPLGDWATGNSSPSEYTHAWDPNVYADAGASNKTTYYPLVVALFDLAWSEYGKGNLGTGSYTNPTTTGSETSKYFLYVTSESEGQEAAATGSEYFAPLPTGGSGLANIDKDAVLAAEAVG
jgi:hypothetical protein